MTEKDVHDLKNALRKLEIMAELLRKRDFTVFSEDEIRTDAAQELALLERIFSSSQ